jgi:hypothetical protein
MVAGPDAAPVTSPDTVTVAFVLLLLHMPPGTPSLIVMADPVHTCVRPDMAGGAAVTVTAAVAVQPEPTE